MMENKRLNNRVIPWVWGQPKKSVWERCVVRLYGRTPALNRNIDIGWEDLSPSQKKYRIKYLWARARVIYNVVRFIFSC